jgi:DnaJ family protein C protein 19
MNLIVLAAAGVMVWGWWSGRLKGVTSDDIIAGLIFLLGFVMLAHGKPLPGAALMAAPLLWAAYRRKSRKPVPMPVEDARRLLGVGETATLEEIRGAHRRLIARVHPDIGGSQELAERVNIARDTLVAEMNRRSPRAS